MIKVQQQTLNLIVVKKRWYHAFFRKRRLKQVVLAKTSISCEFFLDQKGKLGIDVETSFAFDELNAFENPHPATGIKVSDECEA